MKKKYTFLIIPHKSGKSPIEFNMTQMVMMVIGGSATVMLLVLAGSLIYSAHMADMSIKYTKLESTNKNIQTRINDYSQKTQELTEILYTLKEKDAEIRKMLGLRSNNNYFPNDSKKKLTNNADPLAVSLNDIKNNLKTAKAYAKAQNRSYDNLKTTVASIKNNFDRAPSLQPLFGFIRDGFGYRMHPIRGIVQFHSGMDIASFIGAPVRAAGAGVVIASGWDGNYGISAVVDHQNGLRTVYAHLSRALVARGQQIKKGQLIALAGNTGLSTGPHLHFEVRSGNRPINPTSYLNLDIFRYSAMVNRRSL